jgi:hypothetical protein
MNLGTGDLRAPGIFVVAGLGIRLESPSICDECMNGMLKSPAHDLSEL